MRTIIVALALIVSGSAYAKARFQPYEGRDSVVEGRGGTRITKHDIDYWTMGDPPRRYQILGILIDKRGTGKLAGDAVGSKSVAEATKGAGGNAVIIMGSQTRMTGVVTNGNAYASGNYAYGNSVAIPVGNEITQMLVIKYLD